MVATTYDFSLKVYYASLLTLRAPYMSAKREANSTRSGTVTL